MKSNNTIEINGHLYDAKTGLALVSPSKKDTAPVQSKSAPQKSVDGFHSSHMPKKQIIVTGEENSAAVKPAPKSPSRSTVIRHSAPVASTHLKQSVTLHRRGVKLPVISSPAMQKPQPATVSSTAIKNADTERIERSKKTAQSSIISRFGSQSTTQSTEPTTHVQASHPLTKHLVETRQQTAVAVDPKNNSDTKERLIKQAFSKTAIQPDQKVKKSKHKTNRHLGRYASSAAVAVLLAGYVAYLNIPGISMKVAANRAGFTASLPGYTPSGYSIKSPIVSNPGQVTIDFQSNTDERKFSLKQQPTTWDSVALLENFVSKKGNGYLTYQDRGLTIYIYDGSSAAWVSGGKMYSLQGSNSQLDTDQLLKLATSI